MSQAIAPRREVRARTEFLSLDQAVGGIYVGVEPDRTYLGRLNDGSAPPHSDGSRVRWPSHCLGLGLSAARGPEDPGCPGRVRTSGGDGAFSVAIRVGGRNRAGVRN